MMRLICLRSITKKLIPITIDRKVISSLTSFTQPYVTELDLRLAHIPASGIEFLREAMPSIPNEVGEPQYDFAGWLDSVFE